MLLFSSKKIPDPLIIEGLRLTGFQKQKFENQLYQKYHYLIKDGQRKHKLSEDECASIYADAIMVVIESVRNNKFEGRSELKTYIYQIFSNKCVDQIRKNTTNKASVHDTLAFDMDIPLPDESKSIIQQLIIQSDIEKLYHNLLLIGEKCKQIILLWGEGYSDEEIALQLNYNSAAVAKTSRLRCLEKLKENHYDK